MTQVFHTSFLFILLLSATLLFAKPVPSPHTGLSFFLLMLFIYFESTRMQVGEGQREKGRERIPSRLCADVGLKSMNKIMRDHDLKQNQESDV